MNNQSEGSEEDAYDYNGGDNLRRPVTVGSSSTSLQDVETDIIPSNVEEELAHVTEECHNKSELVDNPEFELSLHSEELDLESEMEVNEKPEHGKMKIDDDEEEELDYEEDADDENSRTRSRFTSERKALNLPSTIPRNIPDTLEISKEDEKKIEEFQQKGQRHRDRRNNRNDYLQQRRRQQLIPQHCAQFSDQRGLLRQPMGVLRPPPPLNLHLIRQGFSTVNNSDGLAQSLANVAVNLMMMDGNFHQQLRAQSQALQPLNAIRNQNPSKIAPMFPTNRFQNSDNRLRAPCTLLAPTSSSTTSTFTVGQSKISAGSGLPVINSQIQAGLLHPRPSHQPIFNQSGEIQVVNQGTRPAPHQMMMHQPSASVLPPPNIGGPRAIAQQHNQPIQVIGHPSLQSHIQPGLFANHGRLPTLNLNIPPPQQQQSNFIHQPIRVMVPISRPDVPFNAGGFVPVRGNVPQLHQQGHLQVVGMNFPSGSSISQMATGSSTSSTDLIGQPIETVVLRQSGNKNKPTTRPNNTPPNNVALKQKPEEKIMSRLELEEAEKLARRAARFAKPVEVSSKASQPQRTDKVGSNQILGKPQKRSSSPGSLEVENPAKLIRTSNRKVIARNDFQDLQHRSVLAADNLVSLSGDGDYKDFELMKALEKQKRVREIVMKKKEESRQMQAQMRRKSTDSLSVTGPSIQAPIPPAPTMSNTSQVEEGIKNVSEENKASIAPSSKPMKKVLMTKSQYKALLQHMKSKGIPLPTAIKEVSTKQALSKNEFDSGTRLAKDRRIVQMPETQEAQLLVPPELSSMPSLMVPGTVPIPQAVANHPRFLGLNSGASSSASTVIVSGLASTTKYSQLRSLAEKIGPIKVNIQDDD